MKSASEILIGFRCVALLYVRFHVQQCDAVEECDATEDAKWFVVEYKKILSKNFKKNAADANKKIQK